MGPARTGLLAAAALGLVLLAGACGSDDGTGSADRPERPAAFKVTEKGVLGELQRDANRILDGGTEAFERRLAELRGHPVVANQWASWCGPCRHEFPFFAALAEQYAGEVAFLGVNSEDSRDAAESFLEEFPVPYPHYFDPDAEIARLFEGGRAWPTTGFYSADGELVHTRQGGYASEADLDAEITEFALGG